MAEPQPLPERFEALEAYRGLAALMIVVFHAYQHSRVGATYVYENTLLHPLLRSLDSGVAVFFVLSGFLITLPFIRSFFDQAPYQSARGFLIRRLIRILPLYYIAILLVWTLRYSGGWESWLDLLEHLTFTQIFDSVHIFWTIGPAWSLAVELLFYLVVAFAAPWLYRRCQRYASHRQRKRFLYGLVLVIAGLSLAYKALAFTLGIPEQDYAVYYGFLAKADLFALGLWLALIVAAGDFCLRGWQPVLWRLAALGLFGVLFVFREQNQLIALFFHSLCGLATFLLLGSTVLQEGASTWKRILTSPVFNFLGLVSYSVYIWHEPLLIALSDRKILQFETGVQFPVNTLLLLVIVLLVSAVSYYGIEYPTQYLRHLFTRAGRLAERYPE